MDPSTWAFIKENLTPVFMLISLGWLIHRRILVLGRELTRAERDADYWRRIAERTIPLLESAVARREQEER